MDDLSIEELERRVNETKRRLELIRELSELDKQLGAQQPQDSAQAENIVEVETTQCKKVMKQQNLFAAYKMTSSVTSARGATTIYRPAIVEEKSFYTRSRAPLHATDARKKTSPPRLLGGKLRLRLLQRRLTTSFYRPQTDLVASSPSCVA